MDSLIIFFPFSHIIEKPARVISATIRVSTQGKPFPGSESPHWYANCLVPISVVSVRRRPWARTKQDHYTAKPSGLQLIGCGDFSRQDIVNINTQVSKLERLL